MFSALLLPAVLAAPLLAIDGNSECPTAAAVTEHVQAILGAGASEALAERATVSREGSTLSLTLRGPDGRALGERRLVAEGDCETLAGAAAVVIATWLSDVHPEFVAPLPDASRPELAPQASPAQPAVVRMPLPARPKTELGTSRSPRRFEIEAGFGVSLAGGQPAPLASFGLSWSPVSSGFGFSLSFQPQGSRRLSLGTGEVVWSRWPLTLCPLVRFASGRSVLDLSAGAALGWLRVEGQGFSPAQEHSDWVGGALTRVRLAGARGVFEPFGAAQALYWLKGAEVYTVPVGSSARLPSLELTFVVGLTVRP